MGRSWRVVEVVLLIAIVALGAVVRAKGFRSSDPWFDDAWVVLSTKAPLTQALHMVDTTPLFTLGMRWWIGLHPGHLWWDQIPAFVSGLAAIVAVWALLRYFKLWKPLPLLGALVISASPIVITYSARVKQYNFDILIACAALWLFERWRQRGDVRSALPLALLAAFGLLFSATTQVIIMPICGLVLLAAWVEASRRRSAGLVLGIVGVTFVAEWALWLRHLARGLDVGWTKRGYLITYKSLHMFVFALQNIGSEFFHWMVRLPPGHPADPSKAITALGVIVSICAAGVFGLLIVFGAGKFIRRPKQLPGQYVLPALVIAYSIVLAFIGRTPFGGGRTDEVIYPCVLLLAAAVATYWHAKGNAKLSRALVAGVVVASVSMVVVGVRSPAHYPTINLRALDAKLHDQVKPGDWIVVDPWLTFTWGDLGLSKTGVVTYADKNKAKDVIFDWSQGFHVVSLQGDVVISAQYFFPDWTYKCIYPHTHRLWYVGQTVNTFALPPISPDALLTTRNYQFLINYGWVPTKTVLHGTHTVAILMVFKPRLTPPMPKQCQYSKPLV